MRAHTREAREQVREGEGERSAINIAEAPLELYDNQQPSSKWSLRTLWQPVKRLYLRGCCRRYAATAVAARMSASSAETVYVLQQQQQQQRVVSSRLFLARTHISIPGPTHAREIALFREYKRASSSLWSRVLCVRLYSTTIRYFAPREISRDVNFVKDAATAAAMCI